MDGNGPHVVWVSLELMHPFEGVVIEDTDMHVILQNEKCGKRTTCTSGFISTMEIGDDMKMLTRLTEAVMTQFFLATNLAALTGRSQTSKDLIIVWLDNKITN